MDKRQIEGQILSALDTLYDRDAFLLETRASEWAVTHRLAVYLEDRFSGWDVDCEYNRQGQSAQSKTRETGGRVRPDITIHHRGRCELEHNLLIIEIKKGAPEKDYLKVRAFTALPSGRRPFQYQFGLALSLIGEPRLQWFIDGEAY